MITQKFYHPLSKEGYNSLEEAEKNYKKALTKKNKENKLEQDLELKRNYMRMNAATIDDIPKLLIESVKAIFNADLKIHTFKLMRGGFSTNGGQDDGKINDMHSAPVGIKGGNWQNIKYYPGYTGKMSGIIEGDVTVSHLLGCFSNFSNNGIVGLHLGTGNGGKNFTFEIRIFTQDYPLIWAKYLKFEELKNNKKALRAANTAQNDEWAAKSQDAVNTDILVSHYSQRIEGAEADIVNLKEKKYKRIAEVRSLFQAPPINPADFNFNQEEFDSLRHDLSI